MNVVEQHAAAAAQTQQKQAKESVLQRQVRLNAMYQYKERKWKAETVEARSKRLRTDVAY